MEPVRGEEREGETNSPPMDLSSREKYD